MVNLYSSPPESLLIFLSSKCSISSYFTNPQQRSFLSFLSSKILPTFPFNIFANLSTNCTLKAYFNSFFNNLLKQFCSSDPLNLSKISFHSGGSSTLPKFGLILLVKIYKAVVLPIPLVPTRPNTSPGLGCGRRWSLKLLAPYRWVT